MGSKLGGFFRGLMGSGGSEGGAGDAPVKGEAVEYNGYSIAPECRKQGSQWLTAGVISKPFDDEVKEHHFIRADLHANLRPTQLAPPLTNLLLTPGGDRNHGYARMLREPCRS